MLSNCPNGVSCARENLDLTSLQAWNPKFVLVNPHVKQAWFFYF